MKIEHIIDDIKKDVLELSDVLAEQLKYKQPALNFSISVPALDELSTIKKVALTIEENNSIYFLSVSIHTHNGNRVFENACSEIKDGQAIDFEGRHPLQETFVDLLRDIIKRKKSKMKAGKHTNLYNSSREYAITG